MGLRAIKKVYSSALTSKDIFIVSGETIFPLPNPPRPKVSTKTVLSSLVTTEHLIDDFPACEIELMYYSYVDRLEIILNVDSCDDIDILIKDEEPITQTIENVTSSLFDIYMPVLGYTQKTKRSLSLIKAHSNKKIMPMLVIGTDTKLEHYINDDFFDMHFLDLCRLHITTNNNKRLEIEDYNKNKSKDQKRKKMPQKEYEALLSDDEIIDYYLSIENKHSIIPVLRICINDLASIEYAKNITKLINAFEYICLRINIQKKDISNLQTYFLPISQNLKNTFLVLEQTGTDLIEENNELIYIESIDKDIKIVYLSENITIGNSIIDNSEITLPNNSLRAFKNLQHNHKELIYGDYCGFEKDTAVEPNGFPARTARIFYTNPNNIDEYCIRRARDDSNNWVDAMDLLQSYIFTEKPAYINPNHCEACHDIITKVSRFSLGDMKENCVIHNGICIAMA